MRDDVREKVAFEFNRAARRKYVNKTRNKNAGSFPTFRLPAQ